ncbi:hypothetical protein HPQ61_27535, partial [Acetobacteraceae bacterium]|nr:hypothetical protein [Acetobacteraceae bacterium]
AGRVVMRDGVLAGIDEAAIRAEARELAREQDGAAQTAREAVPWLPHYREMHLRAAQTDVGMMRWVPT